MKNMSKPSKQNKMTPKIRLYTLEIYLISGPVSEKFIEQNPVVSRTIDIRGDQTFEDLHNAIFEAFDREEEHMYEFQIGGKGPQDPKAKRYVSDPYDEKAAGHVAQTRIDSVGLQAGQVFGYWFDYGDDWWHQIDVLALKDGNETGGYPKVTKRIGDSPPQYDE
jgi:hypothetical protein